LALRWTTLEKVPVVGAARRWLYLAVKALGVGPARRCLVFSPQWMVAPFPRDVKPLGLDICDGVTVRVHAVPVLEAPGRDS
jgi:hypothetical protein